MIQATQHSELKATLMRVMTNIQGITGIIKKYQDSGILQEESSQDMVSVLLGPLMARQMFGRVFGDSSVLDINAAEYIEKFLRGRLISEGVATLAS